jgi:two-component system sensor histidine kinase KdpD
MHRHFDLSNLIMVYLLGVMYVASRFGLSPSVWASVLSVAAFDFFFVPPHFTFAVADTQYLLTFAVMLLVGVVISNLTSSIRYQARVAGYRERRAAALYDLSKELSAGRTEDDIVRSGVRHIAEVFESRTVILFPDANGKIIYPRSPVSDDSLHGADLDVAQWVFTRGQMAGRGTNTLAGATATYFPLIGSIGILGVLAIKPSNLRRIFLPEPQRLLQTFLSQIAQAIERVRLVETTRESQLKVETENLRNTLLSAISHDLRTPLAAIVGASSGLVEDTGLLSESAKRELSRSIHDEATRMSSLINNILEMARLDAGVITFNKEWYPIEEIISSVLTRMRKRLEGRPVRVTLPAYLPLVRLDGAMIEQVMVNLLENAAKYTPGDTAIEISARVSRDGRYIELAVADRGPGIGESEADRLFDKFYRADSHRERAQSGVGLGLTICRAITTTHSGRIWAENRPDGGAVFTFTLPLDESLPGIEPEKEE